MYTQVVMFRAGSRPWIRHNEGGGDHPVPEITGGAGPFPESATDVQSPRRGVPRIEATTSFTEKKNTEY